MPSTDATTRRTISSLPPRVSNPGAVEEACVDSDASRSLEKEIQSAYRYLHDYNKKLDIELLDRKKFSMKLQDFHQAQKDLLTQAEQRLEVSVTAQYRSTNWLRKHILRTAHALSTGGLFSQPIGWQKSWQ